MSKATRMLAMAGMALVAGATIGGTPALASTSTPTGPGVAASTMGAQQAQASRHERVVGYYRTLRRCERAGRVGEFFDRWDYYDCDRVRRGPLRGFWALEVGWDGHHGGGNHDHDHDHDHGGGNHGGGNHGGGNHGGGNHHGGGDR